MTDEQKRRRTRSARIRGDEARPGDEQRPAEAAPESASSEGEAAATGKKAPRRSRPRAAAAKTGVRAVPEATRETTAGAAVASEQEKTEAAPAPKRRRRSRRQSEPAAEAAAGSVSEAAAEPAAEPVPQTTGEPASATGTSPGDAAPGRDAAGGPSDAGAGDDDASADRAIERVTEAGAWAAQHARRLRERRPRRMPRRTTLIDEAGPAETAAGASAVPVGEDREAVPELDRPEPGAPPIRGVAGDRPVIVAETAPAEALLERSGAPVSDEALAEATADEAVTPARRRRRGRRGRGGGGSGDAVAGGPGTGRADADEALAPETPSQPPVPEGEDDDGAVAAGGAVPPSGDEGAAEALEGDGRKRRHRGRRGGRRHRRRNEDAGDTTVALVDGDGDAVAEVEAQAAGVEAASAGEAGEAGTSVADGPAAAKERDGKRGKDAKGGQKGRRGRSKDGAGAAEGESEARADVAALDEAVPEAAPEADEGAEPAPARRSRRRGGRRRGAGRNGDQVAEADGTPAPVAVAEPLPETAQPTEPAKGKGGRRKAETAAAEETDTVGRRRGGRLRRIQTTVEPDLPGYKEILVSEDAGEMRVALVEDGRLAEIYIERPGKRSYAGNIYKGKIDNVLPGMDAAFVDVGLERNGFLYVDDIADPENGEKRPKKITQMIKPGQEILVQVSKDPMGSKGARLTGQLSLAGRYLVYVPGGSGVGVSRRLPQDERDRLRDLCKSLKAKNAGLIVRTVAEGKTVDELKHDLQYLSRLWTRLKKKVETTRAPGLVYQEADVSLQVARDLFNESFSQVLVDDPKRRKEVVAYLEKVAPELAGRVKPYDDDEPLFEAHGIEEQIARALERRVPLPSGGNLMIDHAEALTVIDVNTGRFTGGKGLEDTITRNNLEAAREVVRQLRLRDIGGIIIIDFIDMEYARNREAVLAKLQAELETDRTKTYVVEISPLGLVEMTRQNITDGARGILTQTCPVCEGKARVLSPETMAISIERRLNEHCEKTSAKALLLEVNTAVADRLVAGGRVKRLEKATGKRFFLEGSRTLPIESFRIVAEGSLAAVESHRIPVREDQEVDVELEYALTYSPGDAVAHVNGYQVIVLNGRRALGDKRRVRITSLTRAGAMGVLVS